MKTTTKFHNRSFINLLLIIFQVGFILNALGIGFFIVLGIIALIMGDTSFPVAFPVMFSLDHEGIFSHPNQGDLVKFSMDQGMGIIGVDHLPIGFATLYGTIYVLAVSCGLFILKLTISILEAVKNGGFLIIENAIRLRKIALFGIAMYFLDRLATFVSSYYLSDKLEFAGLEFASVNLYTFFTVGTIFNWLFLLVIAEAFRIGALVKQESDLTI